MAIDLAKQNDSLQGIKIQISGRLNGAEIARSEWVKKGECLYKLCELKFHMFQPLPRQSMVFWE